MEKSLSYKSGALYFGDRNLLDFTKQYSGPKYIYNLSILSDRLVRLQKALAPARVYFAMKANANVEVLKKIRALGAGLDVVSLGEIHRALQCGFKNDEMIYSGVGKTKRELTEAIRMGIYQINVESLEELHRIGEIGKTFNKKVPIAIRLNPDVDIKTHPYIATGLRDNKFGIEMSQVLAVRRELKQNSYLNLVGISLHLGSQMHDLTGFESAIDSLKTIYLELSREFTGLRRFDIGGGLGIHYDDPSWLPELELLTKYSGIVQNSFSKMTCELQTEPGRWIVARAGVLLCQVQYIKKTEHKLFAIVDSGMNHLLRPALYGAQHQIWPLLERSDKFKYDVVGPICESADFFAKERMLSELKPDDYVVIADTGAYGYTMANTYNLQALPTEEVF